MADQVKYTNKLTNAKVLVIGGSAGIGFGVAEALVEHGAIVTIASSNPTRVQSTISTLQKSYPSAAAHSRIHGHACDLSDETTVEANLLALLQKTGKLDHIVYTAGDGLSIAPMKEITMATIRAAGQIRFFAPLLLAKHAPDYLTAGPTSSLTLTGGGVADRPIPGWTLVNAFATGLQGMTRGLALDLKPIRINLIQPGAVDTGLWEASGLEGDVKEAMFKGVREKLPVGRVGRVEDLAESYLYCMRDGNVTGETINSSGGGLLV